jgi:hypothetical protein
MSGLTTDQKLALAAVIVAIGAAALAICVPEVRRFLRLEKRETAPPSTGKIISPTILPTVSPTISPGKPLSSTTQKLQPLEILRKQHEVEPLRPSENEISLDEAPNGSYGFIYAHRLEGRTVGLPVPVHLSAESHHKVEIHKLRDGSMALLFYVGNESLTRIRGQLRKGEKMTFFSSAWDEAKNLISIPLQGIKVFRTRNISGQNTVAVDCEIL